MKAWTEVQRPFGRYETMAGHFFVGATVGFW